jgi:DNA adenine methylase
LCDEESNSDEETGFAFFYLNRTNRSGIINGGPIGGYEQDGGWKIDARFNKSELIRRIQRIAEYRHRIKLYNMDAAKFIESIVPSLPHCSLIYLDPPYYHKGQRLYDNYYVHGDHEKIAHLIQEMHGPEWLVSYDAVPEIDKMYSERRKTSYTLNYSAGKQYEGVEVMIYKDSLRLPEPNDPRLSLCSYF